MYIHPDTVYKASLSFQKGKKYERQNFVCVSVLHHKNQNPMFHFKYSSLGYNVEYQPSCEGGTHSPPAMPHQLQCRTACNAAPPVTLQHL